MIKIELNYDDLRAVLNGLHEYVEHTKTKQELAQGTDLAKSYEFEIKQAQRIINSITTQASTQYGR
jgi:hypothetical protein